MNTVKKWHFPLPPIRIAYAIFFAVLAIGLPLISSIGPAWDEPDNIFSGGQYAQFFREKANPEVLTASTADASIFGKTIYSQETAIARYPPFPNMIGTLLAQLVEAGTQKQTAIDIITAFHAATLLFLALLASTIFLLAHTMGFSLRASVLIAAITVMQPTLWGHGLSNLKDTAQVALFTATIALLYRFHVSKRAIHLLLAGVVWGLGLASKFNAVYVPIIWTTASIMFQMRTKGKIRPALGSIFLFSIIGIIVCVAVWPYLWFDPITRFAEVVRYFTSVGQGYKVFWNGALYAVGIGKSLWWYPWMNILFTFPLPIVLFLVVGIGTSMYAVVRHASKNFPRVVLFFWFLIPLLRAVLPNAAFYDGVRHFLEILPPAILLAAFGFRDTYTWLQKKRAIPSGIAWVVSGAMLVQLVWINVHYFPYSTGYLNMLASNANAQFDRDIEALSVKEAVEYLHATYGDVRLWSPIGGHLTWYYLTPHDQYVYGASNADSIVLANKSSHIRRNEFEELLGEAWRLDHTISRGDAEFAWIYRKK